MFGGSTVSRRGSTNWLTRLLVIFAFLILLVFTIFKYDEAVTLLVEKEEQESRCRQKQDSLGAQLQVVYEHKSRLERALQKEKDDAMANDFKCRHDSDALRASLEKEKQEFDLRYSAAQQQHKLAQTKNEDLQQQHDTLQQQFTDGKRELDDTRQRLARVESQNAELLRQVEAAQRDLSECLRNAATAAPVVVTVAAGDLRQPASTPAADRRADVVLAVSSSASGLPQQRQNVIDRPAASVRHDDEQPRSDAPMFSPAPFHQVPQEETGTPLPAVHRRGDAVEEKEERVDAVGQIPLPNAADKLLGGVPDTGRKEEVAQAEQVALPRKQSELELLLNGSLGAREPVASNIGHLPAGVADGDERAAAAVEERVKQGKRDANEENNLLAPPVDVTGVSKRQRKVQPLHPPVGAAGDGRVVDEEQQVDPRGGEVDDAVADENDDVDEERSRELRAKHIRNVDFRRDGAKPALKGGERRGRNVDH